MLEIELLINAGKTSMKVTIQKLGNIQNAEFDLKPLTIFVGPNNTGKTWLAYALAGILGSRGFQEYTQAYVGNQHSEEYPPLDSAIEQVLSRGDAKIDLYDFAENYREKYFNEIANSARNWMRDFMSTQYPTFNDMKISLSLGKMNDTYKKRIRDAALNRSLAQGSLNIRKQKGERFIYLYTSSESEKVESITERIPVEVIKEFLVSNITQIIYKSLYPHVVVFPTERTAIVTFRFNSRITPPLSSEKSQEIAKVLQKAFEQVEEIALTTYNSIENMQDVKVAIGPVANFLTMMKTLFRTGPKEIEKRENAAKSDASIRKFCDLAEILEKEILAGNIAFSTVEPDRPRDILFQPAQNINLEIPIASSMVKELSSLVLYLRYLATPGDLLIIDEPEMNLHPLAQVKIIEFLATLVNSGLKILITTHSTYVVDHLSNLMDAYKHKSKTEIIENFMLEREDALIDQNKVSIYEITENGEVISILDDDGVIHWRTFSDVTDLVQRIHFEL